MFFTNWVGADVFNPLVNNMVNGRGADGGWFGWPDVPEAEELRKAYAEATDPEEQAEYARQLQELAYDEVMYVPVGEYIVPASWSANLGRGCWTARHRSSGISRRTDKLLSSPATLQEVAGVEAM